MPETNARRRLSLLGLFSAACALAGGGTLIAFLGELHWFPELFTHFRVQFAVMLVLGGVVFACARQSRPAAIFTALAAANVVFLVAGATGQARRSHYEEPALTILSMNVLTSNIEHGRALAVICESAADVIVLSEVDEKWIHAIQALRDEWPHMILQPRDDNFGIALLSRIRLKEAEVLELAGSGTPILRASLSMPGGDVILYGVHLLPPFGPEYAHTRDNQMADLARLVKAQTNPVIVVGDFNVTPWSPVWRRFIADSGLLPSLVGLGLCGTWPNGVPLLSIPLDHVLVSSSLRITGHRIGPHIGSDHRPVIAGIAVP